MHRDSTEPSEGAAQVVSRPNCECHGEPCVKAGKTKTGIVKWRCREKGRQRAAKWRAKNPALSNASSAEWKRLNRDRNLRTKNEHNRRTRGWYDEGGMATKPTQFKELNNDQ